MLSFLLIGPIVSVSGCATPLDCSLNGLCVAGSCVCDQPWIGQSCERLEFASESPAAGKDLANTSDDPFHNTWSGPMIADGDGNFHMYIPLYPAGELYHPVSLMHGVARNRLGPWRWNNLTGVDVSINPGALTYTNTNGITQHTLWVSRADGQALGKVYTSGSGAGPFSEIPGSNMTGCSINPSPLFYNGTFYCTGQKGTIIMAAKRISGPWAEYSTIPHHGEDPFLWVDSRHNWHALFHTSGNFAPTGSHCGNSTVSSHVFSADSGKTWVQLPGELSEAYKPTVMWSDDPAGRPQTYATMERPHLYFDPVTNRPTHLGVASTLNIGNEGCPNDTRQRYPASSKCKKAPCPCQTCKYVSHAGTLLITLA